MRNVSRFRTGKLSILSSRFYLAQFVLFLLQNFALQVDSAESSVSFVADLPVEGNRDESPIEQVVSSLLTIALRYGAKGPIDLHVYTEGGQARLEAHAGSITVECKIMKAPYFAFACRCRKQLQATQPLLDRMVVSGSY